MSGTSIADQSPRAYGSRPNGVAVSEELTTRLRLRFKGAFLGIQPLPYPRVELSRWAKRLRTALYAGIALYFVAFGARAYFRMYQIFLPDYLLRWSTFGTAPL